MKIALVLGGGAARALAHIGLLKFFEKKGIFFDILCGNSMGAFVGALYLLKGSAQILENELTNYLLHPNYKKLKFKYLIQSERTRRSFLSQIESLVKKGYHLYKFTLTKRSFIPKELFQETIEFFFGDYTFKDLPLPFACSAVDLIKGEEIIFAEGPLKTAILASCSFPSILPPIIINSRLLIDGGLINRVPVKLAHLLGADTVIAVDVTGELETIKEMNTGFEIISRADAIVRHYLNKFQIQKADLILSPEVSNFHWLDFEQLKSLVAKGEACGEASLPKIEKLLSKI